MLLLHVDYQPQVSLALGGTDASLKLSDLAVLVVVGRSSRRARPRRVGLLRPALVVLAPVLALLAWIGVGVVVGAVSDRPYATGTHLVTAAGFLEYALLAPAVAVLVRTADALRLVLWALVALARGSSTSSASRSSPASATRRRVSANRPGSAITTSPQPGATTLAIGLVAIAVGERWPVGRLREAACVDRRARRSSSPARSAEPSGSLRRRRSSSGSPRSLRSLTARRLAAVTAITLATVVGVVALRGGDLAQFGRFVGLLEAQETTSADVQTYSHRTLLGYFGLRVFADHPVAGSGWQASQEFATLAPYLADARRRFPDVAAQAFPSPAEPYGVQNAYVQALADLGAIGLGLLLAALAIPIVVGVRVALRRAATPGPALAGAAVVLACAGAWTAQGLVAGLPLDALTWFGVGLVAVTLSHPLTDG